MGDCSQSMQAFGSLPEVLGLVGDPRPAWIWSTDGGRILWANGPGGRRLGLHCLSELGQRRYPDSHPLRRDLQNAARMAGPGGALARLRLFDQPRAVPIACRIRRIAAPEGEEGILVVAEESGEAACAGHRPLDAADGDPPGVVADRAQESPEENSQAMAPSPTRSPIPDWIRARLATFPASGRQAEVQGGARRSDDGAAFGRRAPANGVPAEAGSGPALIALSPQERAAFEEIAAALGGRWPGSLHAAANDDAAPSPTLSGGWPRLPAQGAAQLVPSAFCGAAPAGGEPLPSKANPPAARRAGEAAAHLRELRAILDIATDGVAILDGEGQVDSLNGRAEILFGVHQAQVAGQPFTALLAPDSRDAALRCFAEVKRDDALASAKEGVELEARVDGGTRPLLVTFGRLGGDTADRFCAVLRDLTRWKQSESELVSARRKAEEASSQKSDFLARVSHEIRTPLNGIIGFADVIVEERFGPVENQRYREYVRDIRSSGEHVLSLVNDLLDIAKIEAGKLDLNFAPVELNDLVRESVVLMQAAASRSRIILRTSLGSDLPGVRADARTIRQVILNILSNAVKFTGAGGQVIVSTGRAEGGVVLKVRDTGEGMSETELVRALEPFRQLTTAPLGDRTGTGLGLPLTKALVEANRASFAIASAKGEGTIVKVSFPAAGLVLEAS